MVRYFGIVLVCFATAAFAETKPAPAPAGPSASATRKNLPSASTDSAARLPVKRVVLYKNGIGYFEHTTHVRGNQDLAIDFTTGQLNDVLKSLTVLDLGNGRITGVSYNSTAPLERRLGQISGVSERIAVPPCRTSRSTAAPSAGFAVIDEKPSEPPHCRPIFR